MKSSPDPIRVVHLINHLGYGGTERQLVLALRHFDRAEFRHRVLVFNPSPERVYDDVLEELGVEVRTLPDECRGIRRRLSYLARMLRSWGPHVVHSWTVHDNPYAGLAGWRAGVPVRWGSLRGSLQTEGLRKQSRVKRWLMLHGVQKIVVNSRALAQELADANVPEERVFHLPNCVPTPPEVPPTDLSDLGIHAEQPVVGVVGNLRAIKNHEFFVDAMARVVAERPDVRAVIVGQPIASEPDYRSRLESRIESLGLRDRVVLAGFREDVPAILRRICLLCLTSHSEGMPNAVLEAMAAGRPVVACRVGGVPELVDDGVHGLLVEQGDLDGLASSIGRLVDDPALAGSLGRQGKARALDDFGCDVASGRLGDAYRKALRAAELR